ncbi:hypothetical protein [Kibdelosporangium phytohabitans]|nr:hypothetical protein [Kibdelosporangium phytohabitans]MBE1468185.1 hypothetical protein [Kibdelosporangium phytohabitans]
MAVVVSITGVAVALAIGWFTAIRAQYDRLIDVLRYISSDSVTNACHQLGQVIHSQTPQYIDATARHDRINDLFAGLWRSAGSTQSSEHYAVAAADLCAATRNALRARASLGRP